MKKNIVLGIHHGHDSSVTIVKDGKIVASAAEERFTRLKHYSLLPTRSLEFCLKQAGIEIKDVSLVVVPSIAKQNDIEILLGRNVKTAVKRVVSEKKTGFKDLLRIGLVEGSRLLNMWTPISPPSYVKTYKYPELRDILYIEHHLAHAASAYYTSGFTKKTLVITADGSGDGLSTTVWVGENGKLTPRLKLGRKSSLGAFYGLVTEALGWWVGDGEGKTMGLAPYGSTEKTYGILNEYLPVFKNGYLKKGYDWGFPGIWNDLGGAHWHFRDTFKVLKLIKRYGRENIAAEAQRVLEETIVEFISDWVEKEKVDELVLSGGIFLNVKANQRIWEAGIVKKMHVYPDAGDSGISAGAALFGYFLYNADSTIPKLKNLYFGPEYTNDDIESVLKVRQIKYQKLSNRELIKKTADLLAKNKIVAWFQGRMEVGPRALGNRSILMNPGKAENKDIINKTVKYREAFRPFCPSMTEEASKKYLELPMPNASFMVVSFNVPENVQKEIPAVVHVDGTARPQIVKRSDNPMFYDLIHEFGKITGCGVLLNTSFNIRGEPVVASPEDAVKCFYDTGLDYMVIGNFLVSK